MSNIYSAKFMNEASATLRDKVFHKPVNETYLFSTMVALREMNSVINKETEKLYTSIAEAESKEEENKLFAEYFYQFKNIFQEYSNRIQQLKSRMVIAVENKVETWESLFKDDEFIAKFDKEFNYAGYEFFHMEDSDYPRLNLQKLYQKEFDYLGHLMQDNGINASPSAKLKIVATVYNNFANTSCDKNWVKEIIKDMVDIDEKEINKSYSECIYNSLRDKYDVTVNKSTLYTCKENLCDYEDVIDAACKLCDCLLCDLEKVAENISSYLFRNQDNKLKIKTDTDGIIDRDYRLDTYSMNQLDLFMKNKINQIKKLLNIYSIAIGIKFDTVVDYISQNIDILKLAKEYSFEKEEEVSSEEEPQGSEDTDSENNDDSELGDGVEDSNDNKEAIEEEPEEESQEDSEESDDLGDDSDNEESDDDDEEDSDDESFDVNNEDFEEGYLFESELFELEMMYEMYDMHQSIRSSLLLEEETPAENNESKPSVGMDNNQKLADQANVWQRIITKLLSLWQKFKDTIVTAAKRRIEYLKKHKDYFDKDVKVDGTVTLAYNPDITALENLKIEDLNYTSMEQYLGSEDAFCTQYYGSYYSDKGEKSFSDNLKEKILRDKREIKPDKSEAKKAYDFCTSYIEKTDTLKRQMDILEKAKRVANDVSKVQESAVNNDHSMYFSEMEDNTTRPEGEAPKATNKSAKLAVYFKVSSQVLAAKMTMYQKIFNEYFALCHWYIKAAGGNAFKTKEDENKKEEAK